MLSLFPSFFDYNVIAVGVLRVFVAIMFILDGYKKLPQKDTSGAFHKKFLSVIEITGGVFLLAGIFTQADAILLGVVSLKRAYCDRKKEGAEEHHTSFYLLLCAVSLSFLFLGPGLWSIDYPL
jgi:uncharacterized membrane protein YphA (DoxX/SURF4 family)